MSTRSRTPQCQMRRDRDILAILATSRECQVAQREARFAIEYGEEARIPSHARRLATSHQHAGDDAGALRIEALVSRSLDRDANCSRAANHLPFALPAGIRAHRCVGGSASRTCAGNIGVVVEGRPRSTSRHRAQRGRPRGKACRRAAARGPVGQFSAKRARGTAGGHAHESPQVLTWGGWRASGSPRRCRLRPEPGRGGGGG